MKRISLILCILLADLLFCNTASSEFPVYPILKEPAQVNLLIPEEQRNEKYVRLLCVSVKISVLGAAGSGTICHYDSSTGWAYVISCGHLWKGNKSYDPQSPEKAKIISWYHNEVKLESPKTYDAEVLFWSNERGKDVSLLRFKPDWPANYAPISLHFHEEDCVLNSMGCDGGSEVARYEVRFSKMTEEDLLTEFNSPRPGRSGGGLLTDQVELIGICWGSSDTTTGNGVGYFTPLKSIRKVFSDNEHSWLIGIKKDLETIPIIDWDNKGKQYDRHYVPIPSFVMF